MGEALALVFDSVTYAQLGDYAGALDCVERAQRIGDTLAVATRVTVLAALGVYAHNRGEDETASTYCQQALHVLEDPEGQNVETLVLVGHLLADLGHLAEAADAYRKATQMLQVSPGQQFYWGTELLVGQARVSLAQGNRAQALAYVEKILRDTETIPLSHCSPLDPFQIYLDCYRVLRANEDPRARELLDEAHLLLQEWALKIDDEALRRTFLEKVAAHREIVDAYTRTIRASC